MSTGVMVLIGYLIGRRAYRMVLGVLALVFIILMTREDSPKLSIVLEHRAAVALPLLVLGAFFLVFKSMTLRVCSFLGTLTRLSDIRGRRTGVQQVTDVGRWSLWTGMAMLLVSGAIFTAVYLNNCCVGALCHPTIRIHDLVPGCDSGKYRNHHAYIFSY